MSRNQRIKMLDYLMPWREECVSSSRGRLPSEYAWCELVLFISAEQSENIIIEKMHPMVVIREVEP